MGQPLTTISKALLPSCVRATLDTDAVPTWHFIEVPITFPEAEALSALSPDDWPDMVLRKLMLRYIYGGESVRKSMMGEGPK